MKKLKNIAVWIKRWIIEPFLDYPIGLPFLITCIIYGFLSLLWLINRILYHSKSPLKEIIEMPFSQLNFGLDVWIIAIIICGSVITLLILTIKRFERENK